MNLIHVFRSFKSWFLHKYCDFLVFCFMHFSYWFFLEGDWGGAGVTFFLHSKLYIAGNHYCVLRHKEHINVKEETESAEKPASKQAEKKKIQAKRSEQVKSYHSSIQLNDQINFYWKKKYFFLVTAWNP